tara:strand:+ start:635 stop:925 length:291 start_codon:yes stop_codon:yes gene_type:complete
MPLKRGRPSEEINYRPRKYTVVYDEGEGIKTKWIYDLDISEGGPISVEVLYPKGHENESVKEEVPNENLPKTKRKYYNPSNGKYVGYTRARALNLI